jgi:hypothetical protein
MHAVKRTIRKVRLYEKDSHSELQRFVYEAGQQNKRRRKPASKPLGAHVDISPSICKSKQGPESPVFSSIQGALDGA